MTDPSAFGLDQLWQSVGPEDHAELGLLDLQQLVVEQSRVSAHTAAQIKEPQYGVFACLRMWQALARRMAGDWSDTDYYMVYEYLNILTVRDHIEAYIDAMSPVLTTKIRRAVTGIDAEYRDATVEDGGAELAQYWKALAEGRETRWWWTRKPKVLPPGW